MCDFCFRMKAVSEWLYSHDPWATMKPSLELYERKLLSVINFRIEVAAIKDGTVDFYVDPCGPLTYYDVLLYELFFHVTKVSYVSDDA